MHQDSRFADIRLLVSDIDSTLVQGTVEVDPVIRSLLGDLQACGVQILLCTGRAEEATYWMAEELGVDYYVCSNGASGHKGRELLWQDVIPAPLTHHLTAWFWERDIACVLTTPRGYFTNLMTPWIEQASRERRVIPAVLSVEQCLLSACKLQLWGAAHLYDDCVQEFGQQVDILYHPDYLSVGPRGVDKGTGLDRVLNLLNIEANKVLTIGDDRNDIPMFYKSGLSIAVGNPSQSVREAADYCLEGTATEHLGSILKLLLGKTINYVKIS